MSQSSEMSHEKIVRLVVEKELGESPCSIQRMTTGIRNEVYLVSLQKRDVIVRLNADEKAMTCTEEHIALFNTLGIRVPQILGSDNSKTIAPFAYQIQSRIEGSDLTHVIATLTQEQLQGIAREIASISKKLSPLPTNGTFGWKGGGYQIEFPSWLDVLKQLQRQIIERTAQTGVVDRRYIDAVAEILETYGMYFENVPSTFYYDDMSSKNVLIHDGLFSGLVDLDTVAYGDPLEGIGRIQASWYGTEYGNMYSEAIMQELGLDTQEREMVLVYAILNRIYWLSERGIKFNENTSTDIDSETVAKDKKIIDALLKQWSAESKNALV